MKQAGIEYEPWSYITYLSSQNYQFYKPKNIFLILKKDTQLSTVKNKL